ncbi:hypothetical protein ANAPC5_00136 [Anaplasma phagocytophilum]|nr:hypothetical protein ANAPC4_00117 [Anaplasma phagocytophilum]SBO31039.1 hypothetical protein ANAPC3_00386 [Anaplasma phagocytophilum]SBO31373.1 hypothetical protein ANAPC2_00629 [Anaplasma phagocytophilum]SCV61988.1 hypothetical protein ANAPC5_00136 [Anaplasma phagocytophilum]
MHLDYLDEDLHAQIMMHSDSYSDRNVYSQHHNSLVL